MGGRGSFSGLTRTIDDVLGSGNKHANVVELDVSKFGNLYETEDMIRNKRKEVLVVFDKNGTALKAYKGDSGAVAFPKAEAEKWEGLTVTHNHPKGMQGFGGTFSVEDMRCITTFRFGSLRAVASGHGEHNYILQARQDANYMGFNRRMATDIPMLDQKMKNEVLKVKEDYQAGKYKNYGHAVHIARQRSVGILNAYYRKIADEYGFTYRTQK